MAFKDLVCRTSGAPCRSTRAGTQGKAQVSQEKRTGSELVSGDDSAKASQDLKEETAQKSPRGFSCWRPSRRAARPAHTALILGASRALRKGGRYAHFKDEDTEVQGPPATA